MKTKLFVLFLLLSIGSSLSVSGMYDTVGRYSYMKAISLLFQ